LLDENQFPKPVYQGIDFLTTHLSNAQYVGVIDMFDSIEGYEFIAPDSRTWILWSPDEADTFIIIPKNTSKILDKFGNELTPEGNLIVVNSPTYDRYSFSQSPDFFQLVVPLRTRQNKHLPWSM
jgi:hypothetical protein